MHIGTPEIDSCSFEEQKGGLKDEISEGESLPAKTKGLKQEARASSYGGCEVSISYHAKTRDNADARS
jgi:hypothetical protein